MREKKKNGEKKPEVSCSARFSVGTDGWVRVVELLQAAPAERRAASVCS
jgi:hypothetical protein